MQPRVPGAATLHAPFQVQDPNDYYWYPQQPQYEGYGYDETFYGAETPVSSAQAGETEFDEHFDKVMPRPNVSSASGSAATQHEKQETAPTRHEKQEKRRASSTPEKRKQKRAPLKPDSSSDSDSAEDIPPKRK